MTGSRPRNFNDILSKLPDARQSGDEWIASCPLPGHKTPAGHITLKDAGDKALITDQGGRHSYQDICQSIGFDSLTYSRNSNGPEIIATYDYATPEGKLLYQKVRFEPKEFRQRRPDGNGGWLWNLKGISPVLYRLPEVLKAVGEGRTVYVCEGEKDTDALREKGLTATTNSGGAEKWRPEYAETLAGASVVILPDRDAPGQRHAAKVAASLHGKVKGLKVLTLPDRDGYHVKDVSDWLVAGGTVTELEQLVAETPEWKPPEDKAKFILTPLTQLLAEPEEVTAWLWDKTLPRAGLSILVSKPKVGKTTLARNLALKVARGDAFLGRNVTKGAVVYLALEEKRAEVAAHFARMGASDEPVLIHTGSAPQEAIMAFKAAITQTRAVLGIVDPLFRMVRIRDGNDYAEVTLALEPLLMLARETGCHILTVHHMGKTDREGGDGILGSTALFGSVDTALVMRRRESERTLESMQRYGVDIPRTILTFDSETGLTDAAGTVDELEMERLREKILETLGEDELTEKEIRDTIGGNTGLVGKSLRKLLAENEVTREGSGRRGDPFRYKKFLVSRFSIGVKQEKQENKESLGDDTPDYPTQPCRCGCPDYWLREASQWGPAEWLCSKCYPEPRGDRQ